MSFLIRRSTVNPNSMGNNPLRIAYFALSRVNKSEERIFRKCINHKLCCSKCRRLHIYMFTTTRHLLIDVVTSFSSTSVVVIFSFSFTKTSSAFLTASAIAEGSSVVSSCTATSILFSLSSSLS